MSKKKIMELELFNELKAAYHQEPELSYSDIAMKLGHSLTAKSIGVACRYYVKHHGWPARAKYKKDATPNPYLKMSKEELLPLIAAAGSKANAGNKLGYAVKKKFGSWSGGTEAAIGYTNSGGMSADKATWVYLIDFGDFIKIGITQQDPKERFRRFPEHRVLDLEEMSYTSAKSIEVQAKAKLKQFNFSKIPTELVRNGFTECYYKPYSEFSAFSELDFL